MGFQIEDVHGKTVESAIPIAFADVVRRVDGALRDRRRQALVYEGEPHERWVLVDFSKGKALKPDDIVKLARELGCLATTETVLPE